MGRMLRRYWTPAALSSELEAGGAPKRTRLLGEDLVAFRGADGVVGILDENCPHRGASLVLARNEQCALRCLYHGWLIDAAGAIRETPPEPEESSFKQKVAALAYPVREAGGIVWAYLGPAGSEPPFPYFRFTAVPDSHRVTLKIRVESNWVQSLEGVIDSSHSNYLHANSVKPKGGLDATAGSLTGQWARPSMDGAPRLDAETMPYGFRYAAIRTPIVDPETKRYVRVYVFVAPNLVMVPAPGHSENAQIFVPIDDEHTFFYNVKTSYAEAINTPETLAALHERGGVRPGIDFDADYRKIRTRANNWLQDREAMRRGDATGIFGVNNEDIAVQESMGPIYDRTKEHLGTSDVAIIRMRRIMLDGVSDFENGAAPPGLAGDVSVEHLRAVEGMMPIGDPWQRHADALAAEPA